jgi:glycosyltransferase involved in cell wall biosynthesis
MTINHELPRPDRIRMSDFKGKLMNHPPLTVAICIGTFNQAQYLRGCIESALGQNYPIQEIWVSDDASTDDTAQVMESICAQFQNVHYYRHPGNLGLSGNLSWVLAQPKTDLVVRLDSDDRLEPEYVSTLAELMARYPEAGFAHCDVFEVNGEGKHTRVRRLARTSEYESADEALLSSASGFRVAANCLLFRAAAIAEAQYYLPTPTWSAGEDWALCLRLAAQGWGNAYVPRPLTNYRQWDDVLNTRAVRVAEEAVNIKSIYENILLPAYAQRGWDTAVLKQAMRRRAASLAGNLDLPIFTSAQRELLETRLRELGNSFSLSLAIVAAKAGLNPMIRAYRRFKMGIKDRLKAFFRTIESPADKRGKVRKASGAVLSAGSGEE